MPTNDLSHLLTQALIMVDEKLNKAPELQTLISIKNQLLYIKEVVSHVSRPDPCIKKNINIGLLAVRELEADDPNLADILQKVDYYFKKL